MKIFLLALTLAVFSPLSARVSRAAEAPRALAFAVPASCTCASCTFDVHRVLSRFEGVKKVKLSTKEGLLDVAFVEGKQPLSALALTLARLDMGEGSSLLWPVPNGVEVSAAANVLSRVDGIATSKADAKARVVHLTFSGKAALSVTQLDNALQGVAH